jgi:hypothetical protein
MIRCNAENVVKKHFFLSDVPTAETNSAVSIVCLRVTAVRGWILLALKDVKMPLSIGETTRTSTR